MSSTLHMTDVPILGLFELPLDLASRNNLVEYYGFDTHPDYSVDTRSAESAARVLRQLEIQEYCLREKIFLFEALVSHVSPAGLDFSSVSHAKFLDAHNYQARKNSVKTALDELLKERGQKMVEDHVLSVMSIDEVTPRFMRKLNSNQLSDALLSWQLARENPLYVPLQDILLEASRPAPEIIKALEDARRGHEGKLSDSCHLIGLADVASWGDSFKTLVVAAYRIGALGNINMLLLPTFVKDFLASRGVPTLRSSKIENDPRLLETIKVLWSEEFDKEYGSFKHLVETARALI